MLKDTEEINNIDYSNEIVTGYPSLSRMPYNFKTSSVDEVIDGFLRLSKEPYIVTGYTSLRRLVEFFSQLDENVTVRLMMGNEPSLSSSNVFKPVNQPFPLEVEEYWLSRGFSLRQSLQLVKALELFKNRQVEAKYLELKGRMLHAKIYISEEDAAIGSSNFSYNGLKKNIEGNVRFKKNDEEARFNEVCQFAERLWEDSRALDYTDKLYELLEKLLRTVTWQESLSRACSEMLEGNWANQYIESTSPITDTTIWPAQRQGVAQALCILDQVGSVLLADATGSGKTRLGSVLLRALHDRVWRTGQARKNSYTTLICPPGVNDNWKDETSRQGLQIQPFSHGILSNKSNKLTTTLLERALKSAQILCVDEAHNFLNEGSNRTKFLVRNMADHVILQTATPINKGQNDLLSLINILGADNFDPETIRSFNRHLRSKHTDFNLKKDHLEKLKKEISRFTVRRTKKDFNRLIDISPHSYTDDYNRPCRYPVHEARSYPTGESEQAINFANQIQALAHELKGVAYLEKNIYLPENLSDDFSEQDVINWRVSMAKAASTYQIMSHLRSSKAALLRHIKGDKNNSSKSNGMIEKLENISGNAPKCKFEFINLDVPAWLIDDAEHSVAASEDRAIYLKIIDLIQQMDSSREETKAKLLINLVTHDCHNIVIAFDRHPVTLEVLKDTINSIAPNINILIGTSKPREKEKLEKLLKPTDKETHHQPLIVLCSDAMSEGLNFQQASSVVNLDMPSVVRLLEQRVGRIDRMNSQHEKINVYWPDDSETFALKSDEKIIDRHGTVDKLLGSNVPLPEKFEENDKKIEDYQSIIGEHSKHADDWDGLEDAFAPIKQLISDKGLISKEQYLQISRYSCDVNIQLTIVNDYSPWAFFCIGGSDFSAPKWVFFEQGKDGFETDFDVIASELTKRLKNKKSTSEPIDLATQELLNQYLDQVTKLDRQLLPKRKQTALIEMEHILSHYKDQLSVESAQHEFLEQLLNQLFTQTERPLSLDWGSIADLWLDLIRPYWYVELNAERRKRAILLRDLRPRLISNPLPLQKVIDTFSEVPFAKPIENRIVACIITKAWANE